jgi:SapC
MDRTSKIAFGCKQTCRSETPLKKTMTQTNIAHLSSLLFYQCVVALDRDLHAKLRLDPPAGLAFSAGAPVIPLLTCEFADAAREYPIVFLRGAEQRLLPVALTGAPDGQNVYVDAAGRWDARYVPAYVRRYPFIFAQTGADQFTVCIDAACPAFGESGVPLFEATGEPSRMLQQVVNRLGEYQSQAEFTQTFMQRLEAAGLLVEGAAQADLQDGRSLALRGFWIVDEARFRALPEGTLKEWFVNGDLGLIYAHLASLGNVLELLHRRPAATQPTTAAPQSEADPGTPARAALTTAENLR